MLNVNKKIEHWQVISILLIFYDFLAVVFSYFLALWIRFDCRISLIEPQYLKEYSYSIVFYAIFCVVIFYIARLYKSIWRFASYSELVRMIFVTIITGVIHVIVMTNFVSRMPVSYFVIGTTLQFCLTLGIRFSYRFVLLIRSKTYTNNNVKKVMLIGAGSAGQLIFRDINTAKESNDKVVCFIDDNPNKWGRYIDNVPVYGGRDSIMEAVEKFEIDKIYVAIPSAKPEDKRDILRV